MLAEPNVGLTSHDSYTCALSFTASDSWFTNLWSSFEVLFHTMVVEAYCLFINDTLLNSKRNRVFESIDFHLDIGFHQSFLLFFFSSLLFLFSLFPLTLSAIPHLRLLIEDSPGAWSFVNTDAASAWPEETQSYTRPSVYGVNRAFRGISKWRLILEASTLTYICLCTASSYW